MKLFSCVGKTVLVQFKKCNCSVLSSRVQTDTLRMDVLCSHYRAESNGQIEGHMTRLKLLKRQMYDRAKFPPSAATCLAYCMICNQRAGKLVALFGH